MSIDRKLIVDLLSQEIESYWQGTDPDVVIRDIKRDVLDRLDPPTLTNKHVKRRGYKPGQRGAYVVYADRHVVLSKDLKNDNYELSGRDEFLDEWELD